MKCSKCKNKMNKHDEYTDASLKLQYTVYLGDDGSNRRDIKHSLCKKCLIDMVRLLEPDRVVL